MVLLVKRWIEISGDVWKERARDVQLRLRHRFRVAAAAAAVHMNHPSPTSSNTYSSYTYYNLHRWINRNNSSSSTSSSSSTFYRNRKRGVTEEEEDINAEADSVLTRMLRAVAVPLLGNVCHVFMHGLNQVQIYGAEKLQHAVLDRPRNKSLITVSNHVASMDDPLVIAALLPPRVLLDAHTLRWTLCATDRCFRNPVTSAFFTYVKVLPVSRGEGIYQKGMDKALTKLNMGEWVHIFPEGSRSRDGGKTMGSAKRGIGRLVLDAESIPLVVPFVHTGMEEIMPIGAKIPRIGKTVTVLIGDPIDFQDIISRVAVDKEKLQMGDFYDAVAARIGDRLEKLKAQVELLAFEHPVPTQNIPKRAAGILHQVDWESLGMDEYVRFEVEESSTSLKQQVLPAQPCKKQKVRLEDNHNQYNNNNNNNNRLGGGIVSRMRGYMDSDSTELMGFAARGLFMNYRMQENYSNCGVGVEPPLKAWNKFWKSMYSNCNNLPTNFFIPPAASASGV